jgi:hypothetical protein
VRALRSPFIAVIVVLALVGAGATTWAWAWRPVPPPPLMVRLHRPERRPPAEMPKLPQPGQDPCSTPDEIAECLPPRPGPAAAAMAELKSYAPQGTGEFIPVVERWRYLVTRYFEPDDVDRALRVIMCESTGDPGARNRRSSASGLFQHLRRYWGVRASEAGFPAASVFDPEANIAAAAWLVYDGGGWSHWRTSRPCWR